MLALLRQLHPRVAAISGCAILILAGMSALLAWLNALPQRDQLLHLTGQLQEFRLEDARTGTFTMTLLSEGKLYTFDFDNAHRLAGMPSWESMRGGQGSIAAAVSYFELGRNRKVVDVVFGNEKILHYDEVARRTAEKVARDRYSAIGLGAMGALLVLLGGLARLARGDAHDVVAPNPDTTIGVVLWVVLYGAAFVVMLTEPAILHRAFGTEVLHLPIEYVLPVGLALLLLPFWPGFMGLASLTLQAMRKGRGGKIGLVLEMRSALASDNPVERRVAIKALWLFAYFTLVVGAWIIYAAMLGI